MKENILDRIRKAIHFANIIDSTPDISHTDQRRFICRYVGFEDKEVEVLEPFLGFIIEHGKTAYDFKKMILDRLEKVKLGFKKCRGIGFDSVASMAGVHGSVQCLLQNINGKAKFVPCSNHSLNLCGVHASSVNASANTFFGLIERLDTFSSSFYHRWEVLSSHVVTTHWCARYEVIRAVKTGLRGVI